MMPSRERTHLCCTACRIRLSPVADPEPPCPQCGAPLARLAAHDAIGCSLQAPPPPGHPSIDLVALAHAAALVRPEL
jgi:predicted amidophosphoribosyltransferase